MNEAKPWYQSKAVKGFLIFCIGWILQKKHINVGSEIISGWIESGVQLAGGAMMLYSRIVAETKLTLTKASAAAHNEAIAASSLSSHKTYEQICAEVAAEKTAGDAAAATIETKQ